MNVEYGFINKKKEIKLSKLIKLTQTKRFDNLKISTYSLSTLKGIIFAY